MKVTRSRWDAVDRDLGPRDAVLLTPTPIAYAVASRASGTDLLRAIEGRLRTKRDSGPPRRETYYDTFDWRVHRDGGTLTATPSDDRWLLTWRTREGHVRAEASTLEPPGFANDFPPGAFRDELAGIIEMRRLLPVVEIQGSGAALRVLDADDKTVARVELEILAVAPPGKETPARKLPPRVRIVPVTGYDRAGDEVARIVEEELGLRRDESDELTQALSAIGKAPGSYSSKLELTLEPGMRSDRAAREIHLTLLQTILANENGLREDVDSEFLHDFRVSVRRTRSCLGQIKDVFPTKEVKRFREEFAWLGSLTGPTRDMDVYLLKIDDYRSTLPDHVQRDLQPLEGFLRRHQKIEHSRLVDGLDSSRYGDLVRHWREFLETPLPDDPALPNATRPIRDLASERIGRCLEKVLRKGRAIRDDSPAEKLHRLRIECKKLRYLLEFFRSLFEPGDVEPLVKSLKRLQDNLGDFNDLEIQQETLKRFAREMVEEDCATVEALMAMGRLVDRLEVRQAAERARFAKRFAAFDGRANRDRASRVAGSAGGGTP